MTVLSNRFSCKNKFIQIFHGGYTAFSGLIEIPKGE